MLKNIGLHTCSCKQKQHTPNENLSFPGDAQILYVDIYLSFTNFSDISMLQIATYSSAIIQL